MNQIAIRYPTFHDFYLQAKKRAQEADKQLLGHEKPYNIIKKVLLRHKVLNDVQFTFDRDINIKIVLAPTDRLHDIDLIMADIGTALVAAGLRSDPEPCVLIGGYALWKVWQWWIGEWLESLSGRYVIFVQASIPLQGTADYAVVTISETTTTMRYELKKRDQSYTQLLEEDQGAEQTVA